MKKITFLIILLIASLGFSQTPNPNTPTNDAVDVVSIYGDTYTSIATNYDPNWGQSGHTLVNPAFDPGDGSELLAYPNFNYQGTELTAGNRSAMEFLHVEIWTAADPANTDIQVTPINNGTGAGETLVSIAYTSGTWTSVDIPKASFTGMTWDSVFQMKFAANGAGSTVPVDIYLDNIYFWKAPLAPGSDATLSDLQVDGTTVADFAPSTVNYSVTLPAGTTVVPQITTAITNDPAATVTSITQAPAIPGDATVLVTSQNGNFTETYTVSFVAAISDSQDPTNPDAEVVLSIFNDYPGYTPAYTAEGEFGVRTLENLGTQNDQTIKMDFSVDAWGQFNNTTVDVSAAQYLNFSYYAVDEAPGTNGHEVYIMINSGSGEKFYTLKTDGSGDGTLVLGSWQYVSVPLTHFVGFDPATFLVWKLGTPSAAFTKTVYFDNIFFSSTPLALSTEQFNTTEFTVFPNPTSNNWNLKSNKVITTVQVYDISGKLVITLNPNSTEVILDATSLNKGLYFAKINSEFGSKTLKLVRQ